MIIRKYQITKFKNITSINRIINEIKKIDNIFNARIDKETRILIVQVSNEENIKEEVFLKELEDNLTKAIHVYDKKAVLKPIDNVEIYRRVLYLRGLDCAYCATRIENLAKKTFNYQKISVDYPTYRFIIETTDKDLIDHLVPRVTEIAHRVDERIVVETHEKGRSITDDLSYSLKKPEFIAMSIGFILYIWGCIFIHDSFKDFLLGVQNYNLVGIIFCLIGYVLIGYRIFVRFIKNLFRKNFLDENFLMTLASIGALATRNYSEAVLVILLFQIGESLQKYAIKRSRKSLLELLTLDITMANVKLGDDIKQVPVEGLLTDDVVIVAKGEMIPVDGVISKGNSTLDMKNITGESLARVVKPGDEVLSGSINMGAMLEVRVTRTYSNSMMTRIIDLVENATVNKAHMESFVTKFSKFYTPIVVFIGLLIASIGTFYSFFSDAYTWRDAIYIGIEFLVISCPCALVISIPLTFFSSIGLASKRGILIRGSNYLEAMYNVENIVFDKTGTLTKGEFKIIKTVAVDGYKESDIERLLAYTEYYSDHPIGKSIVDNYGRDGIFPDIISNFSSLKGGAKATINGSHITVGNLTLAQRLKLEVPDIYSPNIIVFVFKDDIYIGYVVIGDSIREDAKALIDNLKSTGIENIYMITGDNEHIAKQVGRTIGIEKVYFEQLPDQKVELIEQIKNEITRENSTTIFVGDGINDAPVIAASDVGIAMGDTASDATMSIADVVIMTNDLNKLMELRKIAVATRKKVMQNIVFTLMFKLLVMITSLALSTTSFNLPLGVAIFADVGVSMIAIMNSLTIFLLFKKKKKNLESEI